MTVPPDPGVVAALWGQSSQVRTGESQVYPATKTASTLRNEIGTGDLGKIILGAKILLLDAEEQILPTANYLMNESWACGKTDLYVCFNSIRRS
jgi:hypothetical protein